MATKLNPDAIQDRSIASIKLQDGVIPSESTVSGWGFTKNAGTITGITMNGASKGTSGVVNLGTVITDVSGKADSSAAIGTLSLSINSSNYQITLSGTKVDGTTFTVSDVIDLPLESVVVNGSYDDTTKKVILTLKNGSTIDFSIADLIDGLQSEITSTNKLSADLIEDGTTNKTVTATEKQTWNSYANVQADWNETTTTEDDYILNKPAIKAGTGTNSIIGGDLTNNVASGQNSISTGIRSVASGQTATSIGAATIAKGAGSVAEGVQTSAMRMGSHSQNYKTVAFGNYSHSEGSGSITDSTFTISGSANTRTYTTNTTHNLNVGDIISYGTYPNTVITTVDAISSNSFTTLETLSTTDLTNATVKIYSNIAVGDASHSENSDTKAIGVGSHAEGLKSIAEGSYSHSEGTNTKAIGVGSHTEGSYTITENNFEHAQGRYNKSNKESISVGIAGNTISSIGIGNSESARKNAFEVMQNGDVYVYGVGSYDGTNPTTADTLQDAINNASVDLATPITYSALVTLKTGGNLVPGMQYRITDYTCTTTQTDTQSAGNIFDIIVTADSETELNENARAAHHSGDTYFANCNLDAWELKYSLENDTNRFAWADSTNGKGVIYYMKDEFDNECPYDFKNIKFRRWVITGYEGIYGVGSFIAVDEYSFYYGAKDINGELALTEALYDDERNNYFYTFSITNHSTEDWFDYSVLSSSLLNSGSEFLCYNNHLTGYMDSDHNYDTGVTGVKRWLNNIVFFNSHENGYLYTNCSNNHFLGQCFDNTFGENCSNNLFGDNFFGNTFGGGFYNNSFGNHCHHNAFGENCYGNSFGNECYENLLESDDYYNTFEDKCYENKLSINCQYNLFENGCYYNTLGFSDSGSGNSCYNSFSTCCSGNSLGFDSNNNSFGIYCSGNHLADSCSYNSFGNYCLGNYFYDNCSYNAFKNYCYQNSTEYNFVSNSLGNNCRYNTFGNYCQSITIFDDVQYCNITGSAVSNSPIKNAQILNGTKGTSSSNKLTITFTANQNYTQIAGLVNGTTLRIWIAEDTVTGPSTSTGNNLAAFDGTTGKVIKDSGVAISSLYTKPSTGIPSTDLAQAVQTSLGLADTALQSYTETDPIFTASAAHGITSNDITNWNNKTSNVGTITGITMNGASKGTSGVVNLGTVITSETALSKGTTTGNGNAVTDISVSGHEITLTKGTTFLTQETDPVFGSSAAASITDSQINQWDAKVSANNGILTIQKNGTQIGTFGANQATNETINVQVNELPLVSASDNGKILMVVNGAWSLVTPVSIYSGTSTPDSSLGGNGDLYIQTNS